MNLQYTKLFFTIYFAITMAGLSVYAVKHYFDARETEQVMQQMAKAAKKAKFEIERAAFMSQLEAKKNNVNNVGRQYASNTQSKRTAEARKTNNEVCGFWRKEYAKEKSKYNLSMMTEACHRAAYD